MMTKDQLAEIETLLKALPGVPTSYSYEGQILKDSKGYVGNHVHSVCAGPMVETETEKHVCLGNVIAKDEATAAVLARLLEAAPLLFGEVQRYREAFSRLADKENMQRAAASASRFGSAGASIAYGDVQGFATEALAGTLAPPKTPMENSK